MLKQTQTILLAGQNCTVELLIIEESDRDRLKTLYANWRNLTIGMQDFKSRGINLPEGLSESAFCLEYGSARVLNVIGSSGSFDTINLANNSRQQIKATSILNDLTSFGPRSVWDELYFLDFFRQGQFDGSFDIYRISNDLIYSYQINANETFADQQNQGRRPRLSIRRNIIQPHNIRPEKTCNLFGHSL